MEEDKELTSHEKKEIKRLEREQERSKSESETSSSMKKSKAKKIILWSIAILIVVGGIYFYGNYKNAQPGEFDSFAQCLTNNKVVMYGTEWCPHCQAQKKLLGKSFEYINYVDCDKSPLCDENNVEGYPTWIFEDGSRVSGTQPLSTLAEKSSCELPE